MTRADRAFATLVTVAGAAGLVLALPLLITLFPAAFQRLLHGADALVQACTAALYQVGQVLPPLGLVVLALTALTVVGALGRAWRMLRRTRRIADRRRLVPLSEKLRAAAARIGVHGSTRCVDDPRTYAYCAGLLRPRIWVSRGAVRRLRARELEAVLWHESYHLRRYDPLRIVIGRVIAAALFALPAIAALQERFEVAKELAADEIAIRAQGGPEALASALYQLSRHQPPFAPAEVAAGAWSLSGARVDQLCGTDPERLLPPVPRRAALVSAATLAFALVLALGQAARANLLPAALFEAAGLDSLAAFVHECPLPPSGVIL